MRFVTLFPQISNIHLVKDVGQIPYTLRREFGIETVLASRKICADSINPGIIPGVKFENICSGLWGWKVGSFIYLYKNAKKIDWLNVYHFGKRTYYWIWFFKKINQNGRVYLKLDMDLRSCKALDNSEKARKVFNLCLGKADLVSVESTTILKRIQKYTKRKIVIIPNGYMFNEWGTDIESKEDIFLTVGRLGTKQKATEVLLEAFATCSTKQNWKLRLVGSIKEEFKPYINEYFFRYPELVERVEFVGEIDNREAMVEEYRRAKVFILPSRWEAFPIVLSEAASQGCKMIVTSSVPPCEDFICEPRFGQIVPSDNVVCLGKAMERMANLHGDDVTKEIIENANKKFSWNNICKKIFYYLHSDIK